MITLFAKTINTRLKKKLLNILFSFPKRSFYVTELAVMSGYSPALITRAMGELVKNDIASYSTKKQKRYYRINPHYGFYDELGSLIEDEKKLSADECSRTLQSLKGDVKLIIMSGIFTSQTNLSADLLIVSDQNDNKKLNKALDRLKDLAGQEINYVVIGGEEFEYRQMMNDRFIRDILDNPHIIAVNNLKRRNVLH